MHAALPGSSTATAGWVADLVSGITPATINAMITDLEPWITGTLLPNLDQGAIAGIANDPATISFINSLLPQLDAAALAGIVNGNGGWVADLVSGITPATINAMITDLEPWITGTLLPNLDQGAIAGIANDPATISFINSLLPQLDAAALAGIMNTNWNWVGDLVSGITPATINSLLVDIGPWFLGSLMPNLNENIIATMVNHPNTIAFLDRLLPLLDPAALAGVVNNNGAFVGDLISNLSTGMVVDVVNNLDPAWTSALFTALNNATSLGVIGNIANSAQFTAFVDALIGYLDPAILAGVVNNNGAFVGDLISNLSTGMVVDVVNNLDPAWTSALFTALNNATSLGVIGNIANSAQFTAFVDALIGYLDPAILAGVVNNNGAFVGDLISNLSTGMVVDVVNNLDPAWTSALFTALNNATSLGVIGNIANSAQFTAFVDALIGYLDPAILAGVVNNNGAFVGDLISNLSTGMVVDVVNNLDPAWTSALFTALNNATSLGVIGNIANSAQFTAFVDALIGYLDPAILAGVVNNNGAFVGDLISNLSTGMVVDVVNNLDPAWTSALFTALNNATSLGVIGNIANSAQFTAFVDALIGYLDPAILAGVVNNNGAFVGDLISNLSTGMVVDVVNNLDPAWTSALFTALNNATSLGVIGNIANSAQFTAFVDALIGYLDPAILAGRGQQQRRLRGRSYLQPQHRHGGGRGQ